MYKFHNCVSQINIFANLKQTNYNLDINLFRFFSNYDCIELIILNDPKEFYVLELLTKYYLNVIIKMLFIYKQAVIK